MLIAWRRSRPWSFARSVTPLSTRVASATMPSGIAGFFSSLSSTSRRASSDTWLATFRKRFSTYSRSSSLTGVLRPLTSICMETPSSVDAAFTEGTPRFRLSQRPCVGERRYLERTVWLQLAGTFPQRGARRVHVVDEDGARRDRAECLHAHPAVGEPLRPSRARLARRPAGAPQARDDLEAGPLRDRLREQRRVVEAAPPAADRRRGNRHQREPLGEQAWRRGGDHLRRHEVGEPERAAELQRVDDRARRPLEWERRPRARDRARGHRAAAGARRRQRAPRAPCPGQPRKRRAARRAERVAGVRRRPPACD